MSPTAIEEARRLITKEEKPNRALRVGVRGGGCSGFSYLMTLDDATPKPQDHAFEQDGVTLLVDSKSYGYLDGTTLDFKTSLVGGGFEFHNPQAKKSCGCGTSFSV